ncbi:MAG: WG repeat-containing protein [Bacteroidia bacterium]|nr:WG repeat-containing protein [Bacteroidia bacterium]
MAQNKLFEVAVNDTVTDGLPYYLVQKKTKKPIDNKRYHSIEALENGWFKVEAFGSRVGLVSANGSTVFPAIYTSIEELSSENKKEQWQYLMLYDTLNKVTLYNTKTGKKIEPQFDNAESFCGGNKLISVTKDNKYGFINAGNDSFLFPCIFSSWQSIGNDLVLVGQKENGVMTKGLIDAHGWVIPPEFTSIDAVSENVFAAWVNENACLAFMVKKGFFLGDTSYNMIIANNSDPIIAISRADKYVLYNYQTGIFPKDSFDEVNSRDFQLTTAAKNGQWFILDKSGKIVGKTGKWKSCTFMNDELILVTDSTERSGILHKDGRLIIPVVYQSLYTISYGEEKNRKVIICKNKNKTGLLSLTGTVLIPPYYSDITLLSARQKWLSIKDDSAATYGVADINGNIIVPCIYERVSAFSASNDITVVKNGKFGLFNNKGEVIIPTQYDGEIYFDKKGKASVSKNGVSLIINRKNMPCN